MLPLETCHGDQVTLDSVAAIGRGRTHADLIQSLLAYAALGRKNPGPLTAAGFDLAQLDDAVTLSATMSDSLSAAMATERYAAARRMRDRAYTYLLYAMREIRRVGKFVFARNPSRAVKYASNYFRRHGSGKEKPSEAA